MDTSICVTTFNVNGKTPPDVIHKWFSDANISDFYAIGLQEMDLSVGTYIIDNPKKVEEWINCIKASLPESADNYRVVSSMRLIGIFLVIFQSNFSCVKVSQISASYIATGISMFVNKLGNKGGTAISLRLNDTLVCFVNCHLAAGNEELDRRNQDFRDISQLTFAHGLSIYDHDAVFWFGDLNYRLKTENSGWSNEMVREIASSSKFPLLFQFDQLREQQAVGQVFVGFREPELLPFRPTYKYDVGTSSWDTSEKARVPAWCDRILWWTRDTDTILKIERYESIEEISISDHKPVRAYFSIRIRSIDQAKADQLYEEAIREADRRANELLPQVSLSITEVDFGEVRFLEPCTQLITVSNTGKSTVRFKFIVRPEHGICAKWLQITPPHCVVPVGQSTQISLTVMIDKNIAWELNETKLQDILIMNLENGRDYFVPVTAQYYPRCFGVTLDRLLKRNVEVEKNLIEFDNEEERTKESEESCPLNIPREVYRLICALQLYNTHRLDLNGIIDNSTFIIVRNALENNFPKDLTQLQVPVSALYSSLMMLFDTLKEPLIPFDKQGIVLMAYNDPVALWRIVVSLPPANSALLEYLINYLRELFTHLPTISDQLIAWSDVIFRRNAFLADVPHSERHVVALRSLCAYRKDVVIF